MKIFLSTSLLALLSAWVCAAEDILPVPTSCNAYFRFRKCYTETVTALPTCIRHCPMIPDMVCPQMVKLKTKHVPCHTPTITKSAPCPPCPTGCVIPTSTITSTRSCRPKKHHESEPPETKHHKSEEPKTKHHESEAPESKHHKSEEPKTKHHHKSEAPTPAPTSA
ncbi:uncharacterized protein E0L32_000481 [Thyridium curvatum]|uniref:Uncharacterized protein n=1 Tax=Thyridium curvatum TaxID=1093900 RepID=A0A507B2W9_9PEZI|nr:uncharacterized protein E0L32_000481 [Thyridium curvatum]TPX14087.1 hypothetical protein E0L32_000481 [Thyridium curvatum]